MKIHYPNQWYVEWQNELSGTWLPFTCSVGNKSYAMGFINALCEFSRRPPYRLITNKGELFEVRKPQGPVRPNAGEGQG